MGHLNPRTIFILTIPFLKKPKCNRFSLLICCFFFSNMKCIEHLLCERSINLILSALSSPDIIYSFCKNLYYKVDLPVNHTVIRCNTTGMDPRTAITLTIFPILMFFCNMRQSQHTLQTAAPSLYLTLFMSL